MSNITPEFNKYPKIANFDEVIFIAQQAYELGFRGGTGRELYSWLQTRLDLTGLSNTAGLPEDFPEPNTQLTAQNKGEWTILTPGTYQKQTTGEIVVPNNQFAFAQYDGTDYNLVKFVEMPEAVANGVIEENNNKPISGNTTYTTLTPVIELGNTVDFILEAGQISPTTGSTNSSTNWLRTNKIRHSGGRVNVDGLGTVANALTGIYEHRVAIFDPLGNFQYFIASEEKSPEISFEIPNDYYFMLQVEANAGIAEDIPNSFFWNILKIWIGDDEIKIKHLKASAIQGDILTPQISGLESTVDALKDSIIFEENIENTEIALTAGYLTASGVTSGSSAAGYLRTSITVVNSMASYRGKGEVLYTGKMTSLGLAVTLWFLDSNLGKISHIKLPEGDYIRHNIGAPPRGTVYIAVCSYQIEPKIEIKQGVVKIPGVESTIIYVSKSGNDNNSGTSEKPLLTISRAVQELSKLTSGGILISEGDYRETIDLASLPSGRYSLKNKEGHKVRVLGSDSLTGFTKTDSYNNVYECEFNGSIPNWTRADNPIFEDGRGSFEISEEDRHPLHKNLTYRLPFTPIFAKTSIQEVDNNAGTYYHDTLNSKLYIHTADSENPSESGYSYEVIQRDANTFNSASDTNKSVDVVFEGIQFMYHWSGVVCRGFRKVHFINCVSLASIGSGAFRPDTGINIFEYCEAGYCNNDGFNGHFSGYTGYKDLKDNRSNYPTTYYKGCWSHDNHDDGESSHEHHNIFMDSCLFEFNTKSGSMPSNDATYLIQDTIFRYNTGQNFGVSTLGYGLASVNPPSSGSRVGVSVRAVNCISYGNDYGFGILSSDTNKLELLNCISRSNRLGEFRPNRGVMLLDNCKASNNDPNKILIEDGTGVCEIIQDNYIE